MGCIITPMIQRKSTFFIGLFVFIIPFLGVPSSWKTTFIVLSGLTLAVLSIRITLPKKTLKSRIRKEKVTPVYVESIPVYPKENVVNDITVSNPETKIDIIDNVTNRII